MSERPEHEDELIARLQRLPDEAWDPPGAPPLRIDLGVDAAPARAPKPRRSWWPETLTLRPATAALASLVLLVVGAGGALLVSGGSETTTPAPVGPRVQLAALPTAPGSHGTATMLGDSGMVLQVRGLPASRAGQYYELWALKTPKDLAPIGTFRVGADGRARVQFALGVDPRQYGALDVSVEHDDGNPGHSGDSVLRSAQFA